MTDNQIHKDATSGVGQIGQTEICGIFCGRIGLYGTVFLLQTSDQHELTYLPLNDSLHALSFLNFILETIILQFNFIGTFQFLKYLIYAYFKFDSCVLLLSFQN